ncbi:uncharacterized protein LOC116267877 [Nymphaea colorata]|uniref:uncharacterized protein LOC116267877 n=1 Tax=Nymphaea colorata TaxID=210225 RepID=UPI00129D5BF1|nr:uncharacterized protein LOC116267877 [Nymphaea colorata]
MKDEMVALQANHTWDLVPHTPNMHVIGSRWVFKTKLKGDGQIERLKTGLVAQGYNQVQGLDFLETFSQVTGWAVQIHADLLQDTAHFLVQIVYPGAVRNNQLLLAHPVKLNTGPSPELLLKLNGLPSFYKISASTSPKLQFY